MNSIRNQYKVNFSTLESFDKIKIVNSKNNWLSQSINDHYTVMEVNRLLAGISDIISSNEVNGKQFFTPSLQLAVIDVNQTRIYEDMEAYDENNEIEPSFVLPTQHFLEIVNSWKTYIEQ